MDNQLAIRDAEISIRNAKEILDATFRLMKEEGQFQNDAEEMTVVIYMETVKDSLDIYLEPLEMEE